MLNAFITTATVITPTICINVRVENSFTNRVIASEYSNMAARQDRVARASGIGIASTGVGALTKAP
jgi:hypothetical protein